LDGKPLNLQTLTELFELNDQKKQFDVFFSGLTEENWETSNGARSFSLKEMPYQLKL
jgi:hypothetical protein